VAQQQKTFLWEGTERKVIIIMLLGLQNFGKNTKN
jgi:hypothetical protein